MCPPDRRRSFSPAWLAAAFACGLGATSAGARLILVFPTSDDLATNGNCTLREAVQAAQSNLPVDACPPGSSTDVDVVQLAWGPYTVSLGEISIGTGEVILRGAATPPRTVVRATSPSRLFFLLQNASVTFEVMDLELGDVRNGGQAGGGAIRSEGASLALSDVTLRSNKAVQGGALYVSATNDEVISIVDSLLELNRAEFATVGGASGGGAFFQLGGKAQVSIRDTVLLQNVAWTMVGGASVFGGALHAALSGSARLDLERVHFQTNAARAGSSDGQAYAAGMVVLASDESHFGLFDSSFVGNSIELGGAFSVSTLYLQGEIAADLQLERVRMVWNDENQAGRGVLVGMFQASRLRAIDLVIADGPTTALAAFAQETSQLDLGHLTVTGHAATGLSLFASEDARLALENSIVWNNGDEIAASGPVETGPSNLVGVDPDFVDAASRNYELLPGSLAIDHGDRMLASVGRYDVAHAPRVGGVETDAGAYEFGAIFGDGLESGDAGAWSESNLFP